LARIESLYLLSSVCRELLASSKS